MPGCNLKKAREKAELLRKTIENYEFVFHPPKGAPTVIEPVTVSIGVGGLSLLDEQGTSDELKARLEKRADALVYAAKHFGRNTVVSQDAVDMRKLYERKEKEESKILPTSTATTAEAATGEAAGKSASSAPGA